MPILSILSQPADRAIKPVYMPILLTVKAKSSAGTAVPPVVYCDVYLSGVYYKTIAKTVPVSVTVTDSTWTFDIQDICREKMQSVISPLNGSLAVDKTEAYEPVFCRFRSSGIGVQGFIESEGQSPIQGTSSSNPVAGAGTQSENFFAVNIALQPTESLDITENLNRWKYNGWYLALYPLSRRPAILYMTLADSDYMPILDATSEGPVESYKLNYKIKGQETWRTLTSNIAPFVAKIWDMPCGPANLRDLFPNLNWSYVGEYFLQALSGTFTVVASSPTIVIVPACDDNVRIFFVNGYGGIDAINMELQSSEVTVKSSYLEKAFDPFTPYKHSRQRNDLQASTSFTCVTADYDENAQEWISELFRSPLAWVVRPNSIVTGYYPINILDGKMGTKKYEERYSYETQLTFEYSSDLIPISQ